MSRDERFRQAPREPGMVLGKTDWEKYAKGIQIDSGLRDAAGKPLGSCADSVTVDFPSLSAAVADGMGHGLHTKEASQYAASSLVGILSAVTLPSFAHLPVQDMHTVAADATEKLAPELKAGVKKIHRDLIEHFPEEGTTVTGIRLIPTALGIFAITAHVGDSAITLFDQSDSLPDRVTPKDSYKDPEPLQEMAEKGFPLSLLRRIVDNIRTKEDMQAPLIANMFSENLLFRLTDDSITPEHLGNYFPKRDNSFGNDIAINVLGFFVKPRTEILVYSDGPGNALTTHEMGNLLNEADGVEHILDKASLVKPGESVRMQVADDLVIARVSLPPLLSPTNDYEPAAQAIRARKAA